MGRIENSNGWRGGSDKACLAREISLVNLLFEAGDLIFFQVVLVLERVDRMIRIRYVESKVGRSFWLGSLRDAD